MGKKARVFVPRKFISVYSLFVQPRVYDRVWGYSQELDLPEKMQEKSTLAF